MIYHHEFLEVRRGHGPMGEERRLLPWHRTHSSGLTFVRWIDG